MIAQQIQIPSNVFYQIVCCIVFVSVELASPVGLELVVSGRGKAEMGKKREEGGEGERGKEGGGDKLFFKQKLAFAEIQHRGAAEENGDKL